MFYNINMNVIAFSVIIPIACLLVSDSKEDMTNWNLIELVMPVLISEPKTSPSYLEMQWLKPINSGSC
jgi:hypothetical protein